MKGLIFIPTLVQLSKAYEKIQIDPKKISVDKWTLWSQWSRFDARLAEQLVLALSQQWKNISSVELNQKILKQPWPAALGVLLGHVQQIVMENKNELALFQAWFKTVMTGIAKSTGEQFFIGLTFIGSRRMRKESLVPTKLYTNWGYLGSDYLFNKKKPTRTISQKSSRINVLNELIRHKQRFTVKDYIAELGQSITIRQAQRDLKSHNCLKKIGNTRGTFYVPVF